MNSSLGYGSFIIFQLSLIVVINKVFGLSVAGNYFLVLSITTPIFGFLSFAIKQRAVYVGIGEITYLYYLRSLITFFVVCVTIVFSVLVGVDYLSGFILLVVLLKVYEWAGELSVGRGRYDKNMEYFFGNVLLIVVLYLSSEAHLVKSLSVALVILSILLLSRCVGFTTADDGDGFIKWFLQNVRNFISAGLGLAVMSLSAMTIRVYVEASGGAESVGVFGNIIYAYVLGLFAINVLASRYFDMSLRLKLLSFLVVILAMLAGFAVAYFFGRLFLEIIFGLDMVAYFDYLLKMYPVLCIGLLVSFVDYYYINKYGSGSFLCINGVVFVILLCIGWLLYMSTMDSLTGGLLLLLISVMVKLLLQVIGIVIFEKRLAA